MNESHQTLQAVWDRIIGQTWRRRIYDSPGLACHLLYQSEEIPERIDPYLGAYFNRTPAKQDKQEVTFFTVIEDDAYETCSRNIDRWIEKQVTDAGLLVYREASGTIVICQLQLKRHVYIIDTAHFHLGYIQDVYCGMRRCMLREYAVRGCALIHAAAIQIDEIPILVAGVKGAGKSYYTYHAMTEYGAAFLAADQTVLYKDADGRLRCTGHITCYRMEIQQAQNLLETSCYNRLASVAQDKAFRFKQEKINLPACFLDLYLHIPLRAHAGVPCFIFLEDLDQSGEYRRLDKEQLKRFLQKYLLDDPDRLGQSYADAGSGNPLLEELVEQAQGYVLKKRVNTECFYRLLREINKEGRGKNAGIPVFSK